MGKIPAINAKKMEKVLFFLGFEKVMVLWTGCWVLGAGEWMCGV